MAAGYSSPQETTGPTNIDASPEYQGTSLSFSWVNDGKLVNEQKRE